MDIISILEVFSSFSPKCCQGGTRPDAYAQPARPAVAPYLSFWLSNGTFSDMGRMPMPRGTGILPVGANGVMD
jgi:hypothetical protein